MFYALVSPNEDNRVAEVSTEPFPVAPPLMWVPCPDNVAADWTFQDGQFVEPAPQQGEPVVPFVPRWTPLQFIERFTDAEQLAIVTAAQSTPALRLWYDKAMAADEIVSDDPRTIAGVQALVDAGLISAQRKTEILGG